MAYLKSLPENAVLLNVFKAYPGPARKLIEYHEEVLRGPSAFSAAERELIAAFVSALNGCRYCRGVHAATAEAMGCEPGVVEALMLDIATAPVEARLKPVLAYARVLTETPDGVREAHVEAMRAAGWDDKAVHDAASVCALFNFMNRFVEGLGVRGDAKYFRQAAERIAKTGYKSLLPLITS